MAIPLETYLQCLLSQVFKRITYLVFLISTLTASLKATCMPFDSLYDFTTNLVKTGIREAGDLTSRFVTYLLLGVAVNKVINVI